MIEDLKRRPMHSTYVISVGIGIGGDVDEVLDSSACLLSWLAGWRRYGCLGVLCEFDDFKGELYFLNFGCKMLLIKSEIFMRCRF